MECQGEYNQAAICVSCRVQGWLKTYMSKMDCERCFVDNHSVAAAMMLAKPLCSQRDAVAPD